MNRGDVPAPHRPPGAGEVHHAEEEDVVFDTTSLAFVKDWVDGEGGTLDAPQEAEHRDELPRQQRRLGVGAEVKKIPKKDREVPTALEKKMTRKRRRRLEESDSAHELTLHGIEESDENGEGGSKTASFKSTHEGVIKPSGSVKPTEATEVFDGILNKGRKRTDCSKHVDVTVENEEAKEAPKVVSEKEPGVEGTEDYDGAEAGERKKRRGWGNRRSGKKIVGTEKDNGLRADKSPSDHGKEQIPGRATQVGDAVPQPGQPSWKRKKVRSRQKNIRKDKRSMEQRPAHLRLGDPGFSGRDLTEETRQRLGLSVDDKAMSRRPSGRCQVLCQQKCDWRLDATPSINLNPHNTAGKGGGVKSLDKQNNVSKGLLDGTGRKLQASVGLSGANASLEQDFASAGATKNSSIRKKRKYKNLRG